jgi:hypothetical protein
MEQDATSNYSFAREVGYRYCNRMPEMCSSGITLKKLETGTKTG